MGEHNPENPAPPPWLRVVRKHVPNGEVAGYIAFAGLDQPGYAVVKLPADMDAQAIAREAACLAPDHPTVSELIATALAAHATQARELEGALAEQTAYNDELLQDQARLVERAVVAERAADQLREQIAGHKSEIKQWRARLAVAEGQLIRAGIIQPDSGQAEPDPPAEPDSPTEPDPPAEPDSPTALEQELADTEARLARAETANAIMEARLRAVETARAELAAELRAPDDPEPD